MKKGRKKGKIQIIGESKENTRHASYYEALVVETAAKLWCIKVQAKLNPADGDPAYEGETIDDLGMTSVWDAKTFVDYALGYVADETKE